LNWFNQERAKAGLWVKKTMIAISLYDVFPKLPLLKCPTLVLFGDKDILFEKERILLQGIKGAQRAVLADAGHVPQVEKPDSFVQEVSRFLSSA
jgi:pimeloyl-ACP methyl ester carboxylesterase